MKDVGLIDLVLVIYLFAFTLGLNAFRSRARSKVQQISYLGVCFVLGGAPFFALKTGSLPQTATTIVLATIILIWFAILAGRQPHAA